MRRSLGFSLIEVVLAIGIFLITVLALVGLLGPTLQSVDEVESIDEVTSVVNTVNAFLQSSPEIAPNASKFNAIYEAVETGDHATIFVFERFVGDENDVDSTEVELVVGFLPEASVDAAAELDAGSFDNIAGPAYRVVLSASSVTPDASLDSTTRAASTGVYSLSEPDPTIYPEGYLAMEIRIFRIETDTTLSAGGTGALPPVSVLTELVDQEPVFTYNTAVVR